MSVNDHPNTGYRYPGPFGNPDINDYTYTQAVKNADARRHNYADPDDNAYLYTNRNPHAAARRDAAEGGDPPARNRAGAGLRLMWWSIAFGLAAIAMFGLWMWAKVMGA